MAEPKPQAAVYPRWLHEPSKETVMSLSSTSDAASAIEVRASASAACMAFSTCCETHFLLGASACSSPGQIALAQHGRLRKGGMRSKITH